MKRCPDERPYQYSVGCMSCDEGYGGYASYYMPDENKCLERCPEGMPEVGNTKVCTSCRARYPDGSRTFWDLDAEECVASCSETSEDGACVSCANAEWGKPFWNTELGRCTSCADAFPGEKELWNPNTQTCVAACPAATPKS